MDTNIARLLNNDIIQNLIVSLLALIGLLLLRRLALGALIKKDLPAEERRRIVVNTRNLVFLSILIVFIFIWAQEIRSLALSAVAIAAAIVIATKELILCLSGSILRTRSRSFSVGDRVEIGAFRGDVIDQTLLATTLLEIGPGQTSHQHTGRAVIIPNAILLNVPVINETFMEDYVLHVFTVPIKTDDDWQAARDRLLSAAREACAPYLNDARKHFEKISNRYSLNTTIDPRVYIRLPDPGRVDLMARIPVPARRKGRVEQTILERFLLAQKEQKPGDDTPMSARENPTEGDEP